LAQISTNEILEKIDLGLMLPLRGGMVVQPQKGTFYILEFRKLSLKISWELIEQTEILKI